MHIRTEATRKAAREYTRRVRKEGRSTSRGVKYLLSRKLSKVQQRAKEIGVAFDLKVADVAIPPVCPVLGIPLHWDALDNTPSFDRLNQSGGYTKDNVRIISFRANTLRGNGGMLELLEVALDSVAIVAGRGAAEECAAAIMRILRT